ncbi:hypothetical protein TNCV_1819601 [Trichonephila clavipes]|nr:hypothetical protein TNCV_1819601 [Trichonephila clavipes]
MSLRTHRIERLRHFKSAKAQSSCVDVVLMIGEWGDNLEISFSSLDHGSKVVDSSLVYGYRCTNVGFVNSSTSSATWIGSKGAFIQDPSHDQPSTAAFAMGS